MAMFPCITGIPTKLNSDMQAVLNKKMGTSGQTYPSQTWADEVNLMGKLPEKTVSGAVANMTDGADGVPLKELIFSASPIQASGTPSPSNPLPISGHNSLTGVHCGKNLLPCGNADSQTVSQVSFSADGEGRYTVSGTASGEATAYFPLNNTYTIKDGDYLHIMNSVGLATASIGLRGNNVAIVAPSMNPANRIYNLSSYVGKTIDTISIYLSSGSTFDGTITPMILNSNQATTYAPYSAESKKWEFPPFGKNLFDKDHANVVDGYIDTANFNSNNVRAKTIYIPISGGQTYTVSKTVGARFSIATSNVIPSSGATFTSRQAGNTSASLTITAGANDTYLWAWVYLDGTDTGTLADMLASVQIETGSTATAYEPYQSMFSGQVNALTGEVESNYKKIVITSASDIGRNDGQRYYILQSKTGAKIPSATEASVLCDKMPNELPAGAYHDRVFLNTSGEIRFDTTQSFASVADMLEYFGNSIEFCYPLATPISIDMDSVDWQSKYADNNFYNDCGDTSCTYRQDIDLALSALQGSRGLMASSMRASAESEELSENSDNEEEREER